MLAAEERFGIELVDVFGARRACREPGILGRDLEPADRGTIARRVRELRCDRLTRELAGRDRLGCEARERGLLRGGGWGIHSFIDGCPELGLELGIAL